MMSFDQISALSAFAFATLMTPGPNNLMLMASGMNYGWVRTLPHMFGIGIGFPVMIILVGLGLMQVFEFVPHSYVVLKIVSAAYLLYLAWKIATASPPDASAERPNSKPFTFLQAAAFQWVNPKAWAMALTAISVYTPPDRPLSSVLIAGFTFVVIGAFSISAWAFLGQQLRRILGDPWKVRAFNIACAVLLVASLLPALLAFV